MDVVNLPYKYNYNTLCRYAAHTANDAYEVILMIYLIFDIFRLLYFTNAVVFIDRHYKYADESANHTYNL